MVLPAWNIRISLSVRCACVGQYSVVGEETALGRLFSKVLKGKLGDKGTLDYDDGVEVQ